MKTKHHSESDQLTDEIFFLLTLIIGRQQGVDIKTNKANRKVNGEREPFLNSWNLQEKKKFLFQVKFYMSPITHFAAGWSYN